MKGEERRNRYDGISFLSDVVFVAVLMMFRGRLKMIVENVDE